MEPNITHKGRVARAISGGLCCAAGVAVAVAYWPDLSVALWTLVAVLIAVGLFQFYEAKKSWCAVRALGIKTPM